MIDSLFGSKTRVKLLHLFLNSPDRPFYVREITRKIEEQINSVRRELSNMLEVGIITCDSADNKLYYKVNQRYEYYVPLREIFSDEKINMKSVAIGDGSEVKEYSSLISELQGVRVAIFSGFFVTGSISPVDILLVGDLSSSKVNTLVKYIEKTEGRDIKYSILSYDDFYYRFSVRDRFITEILNSKHNLIVDQDKILSKE